MIFKQVVKISVVCCIFGLFNACGGGSGGNSEGSLAEGITVTLTASPHQSPDATGKTPSASAGVKTFYNSEGIKITLNKAYLVIWSVHLTNDCSGLDFARLWTPLLNVLLPTADAHAQTTPTQLGVPNVLNVLNADEQALYLGDIYPAPASYCGITLELMKADEDTQYLPPTINMINRVLYVEGEYLPRGTTTTVAFTLDLAKTPRPQNLRFANPLVLSSSQLTAKVATAVYYDRWFDGIDFSALETDTQIDWILNNVTESIKLAE
ncbi:hypothetical protein [Beggiatoa leptomitoformis]|uniref:DUF4382 domain-containing protein n=1 Tax=Beggiatoa leptomitoformis TaxID=288004 RepID=A0A2N9YB33_9GAMM|nr:hypothetical protein [Beggiatoa leptomitoformis]ALG66946.1 hypothetical protein AL038_03465 [Beggiatoa leptomitoformis]AUI67686.1 hypothetical protein BLE401_02560 [Beggiatoa leptomitoformis]